MPTPSLPDPVAACLDEIAAALAENDGRHLSPARRRIVEATIEASRGQQVGDVTLREIAKRADIQAASIYSHYPDGKLELFVEAFTWHYAQFLKAIHAGVVAESGPRRQLAGLIAAHVREDFETDDTSPSRMLPDLWTPNVFRDPFTSEVQAGVARLPQLFRRLVTALLQANGLKSDADQISALVVMLLNRMPEWDPRVTQRENEDSVALAERVVRALGAL